MTKWIAVVFAMAFATSAHAMTPIPVHHADVMVHTGIYVCGPGITRVGVACPKPPPTGVRDGMETFAFGGTEYLPR